MWHGPSPRADRLRLPATTGGDQMAPMRRAEKEAERLNIRRALLLAKLEMAEGLDQLAEEELRTKLAVIEEGRGVALERSERVRHRLQT